MIEFKNVEIRYGDFVAIECLNLNIEDGEFFTFLGPSGCGKTTSLRALVGFLTPTKGEIMVDGKNVVPMAVVRREIGMVFQSYAFNDAQLQKNVAELSGGQQQRVALARAIVLEPKILCLDEPLSNLDAKLRIGLRGELKRLQKDLGITTLYVTHDQEEALTLSDRIAVFNNGYIEQVGAPYDIYNF